MFAFSSDVEGYEVALVETITRQGNVGDGIEAVVVSGPVQDISDCE